MNNLNQRAGERGRIFGTGKWHSVSDAAHNRERRIVTTTLTEPKRTSARNSAAILLPHEDASAYDTLVAATMNDLAPETDRERALALNVANTIWRRGAHAQDGS